MLIQATNPSLLNLRVPFYLLKVFQVVCLEETFQLYFMNAHIVLGERTKDFAKKTYSVDGLHVHRTLVYTFRIEFLFCVTLCITCRTMRVLFRLLVGAILYSLLSAFVGCLFLQFSI